MADRLFAGVIEAPEGPWTEDDRAWLLAHPRRDVRIRAPYPGELGPLFDPPGVANAREFRTVFSDAARRYRTRNPELVMRVAVLRALVSRPAVVFADEPTGNLDSSSSAEILALLRRSVDDYGQTIVMVTHDDDAASHADRLLVLRDGKIVEDRAAVQAPA